MKIASFIKIALFINEHKRKEIWDLRFESRTYPQPNRAAPFRSDNQKESPFMGRLRTNFARLGNPMQDCHLRKEPTLRSMLWGIGVGQHGAGRFLDSARNDRAFCCPTVEVLHRTSKSAEVGL